MHFSLVKIAPEGHFSANGFDDVILPLSFALRRLGYSVEILRGSFRPDSVNIFFGSCQAPLCLEDRPVPANSIVFNLEQISVPGSPWNNAKYREYQLKRFPVWDYSTRNVAFLRDELGVDSTFVRLGYVPEMTRLTEALPRDIDVLFYGGTNERRKNVLDQLARQGVRLCVMTGVFGAKRDYGIARARLLVNIHAYSPATLELPRLGYLWANGKAVVSELGPETEMFPGLEDAAEFCDYDALVPTVHALLRDREALDARGRAGFAAFSAIRQEDVLQAIVGRRNFAAAAVTVPSRLQAGSGRDFREDCLNVDSNPAVKPDIVLDLSAPLDAEAEHETARFGTIRLQRGYFSHIRALDMLEHVADLPATMTNFLDLLEENGLLEIMVPYDLSLGAWQDPTHVRSFNENSWPYYGGGEEAWSLGWREYCFGTVSLDYVLSGLGSSLSDSGVPMEELVRTPRAVDSMRVVMRKRKQTPAEREKSALRTRVYLARPAGEWAV